MSLDERCEVVLVADSRASDDWRGLALKVPHPHERLAVVLQMKQDPKDFGACLNHELVLTAAGARVRDWNASETD